MSRWRVLVVAAVAVPVVALVALVVVVLAADDTEEGLLAGTPVAAQPAVDLTLADPDGRPVSLRALRGQVVVLTFLYTSCPDVCPLTADLLAAADRELGDRAADVRYVIVSVDPERDTPEARRIFLARHRLPAARSHYLSGPAGELARLWRAHGVSRAPDEPHAHDEGGEVTHTDVLFLIDADGDEREVVRSDVDRADLVHDLRVLLDS